VSGKRCIKLSFLKVFRIAPGVWRVEEHNEDLIKEVLVWINLKTLKSMQCNCSSRAFRGFKCRHIRKVMEVEKYE